jgi:hypothetical protein
MRVVDFWAQALYPFADPPQTSVSAFDQPLDRIVH